jgi:MoxR-like ATPase
MTPHESILKLREKMSESIIGQETLIDRLILVLLANGNMLLEHTKKHIAETRDIHDPSFKSTTNYVYWICPGANERK